MYITSGSFNNYWNAKTMLREKNGLPYFRNCSITNELKERNKINDQFETMINNLTLEELIALKLERSSKTMNGKLTGFPVYEVLNDVIQNSVLKFIFSTARNHKEACMYLGITLEEYKKLCKQYGVIKYFTKPKKDK